MNRRKFFEKSILVTGGLMLASIYISCNDDDMPVIDLPDLETNNFFEGVASFDPTNSNVIIWTRFTPPTNLSSESIVINWQVSDDIDFKNIIRNGEFKTDSQRDYTVAIDVQELSSNGKFYYRFFNLDTKTVSVTGETITLPDTGDAVPDVKLAVCSCANYAAGLFNVYDAIAKSDTDVVVHLGDYIYEYGEGEYGTNENTVPLDRVHSPKGEIITLEDYRNRYKQYRGDAQLQLAHQKKPFICVWDDHEITNDAYKDGAENHQGDEGNYQTRKETAIKVYSEYLPLRSNDPEKIYRSFDFGTILSLHMLDTRIIGRDKQLSYGDFLDNTGQLDGAAFQSALLDTNRKLLGSDQLTWLSGAVSGSGANWQVLGQQVLVGKMFMPAEVLILLGRVVGEIGALGTVTDATAAAFQVSLTQLTTLKGRLLQGDTTLTLEDLARLQTVVPYNLDAWDGYFAEREQLYAILNGKKTVCLAGDTHNAWYSKLVNTNGDEIGVEFATSSVTSPGFEGFAGLETAQQVAGLEFSLKTLIDDLQYTDLSRRGYLKVTFTAGSAEAQWNFINTIAQEGYTETVENTVSYS